MTTFYCCPSTLASPDKKILNGYQKDLGAEAGHEVHNFPPQCAPWFFLGCICVFKVLLWFYHAPCLFSSGDVLFKLLLMFSIIHSPSQMQGMDRKYDGHVWCKLVRTNIKNLFRLRSRKARCLSHLWCVHDDCGNFLLFASCNETF